MNRTLGVVIATFQLQSSLCDLLGEHCRSSLRLTKIPASKGYVQDEEYVHEVSLQAVPVALWIEEIEEVSFQAEELEVVREALETGHWSKAPKAF